MHNLLKVDSNLADALDFGPDDVRADFNFVETFVLEGITILGPDDGTDSVKATEDESK